MRKKHVTRQQRSGRLERTTSKILMYNELSLQLQKEAEMDGGSEDMETGLTMGGRGTTVLRCGWLSGGNPKSKNT